MNKTIFVWMFVTILLISIVIAGQESNIITVFDDTYNDPEAPGDYYDIDYKFSETDGWQKRDRNSDGWQKQDTLNDPRAKTLKQKYEFGLNQILQSAQDGQVVINDNKNNRIKNYDRADLVDFNEISSTTAAPSLRDVFRQEEIYTLTHPKPTEPEITRAKIDQAIQIANQMETAAKGGAVLETQKQLARYMFYKEKDYVGAESKLKDIKKMPGGENFEGVNDLLFRVLSEQGKTNEDKRKEADAIGEKLYGEGTLDGEIIRGRIEVDKGDTTNAIKHFKKAEVLGRDALKKDHSPEETLELWRKIQSSLVAIGDAQTQTKKFEDAIESYNDALVYNFAGGRESRQEIKSKLTEVKILRVDELTNKASLSSKEKQDLKTYLDSIFDGLKPEDLSESQKNDLYSTLDKAITKNKDDLIFKIDTLENMQKIAPEDKKEKVTVKFNELNAQIGDFDRNRIDELKTEIAKRDAIINDNLATEADISLAKLEKKILEEEDKIIQSYVKLVSKNPKDAKEKLEAQQSLQKFMSGDSLIEYDQLKDKLNGNDLIKDKFQIESVDGPKDSENILTYVKNYQDRIKKLETLDKELTALHDSGITKDDLKDIKSLSDFNYQSYSSEKIGDEFRRAILTDFKKTLTDVKTGAQKSETGEYSIDAPQLKRLKYIGLQSSIDDKKEVLRMLILSKDLSTNAEVQKVIENIFLESINLEAEYSGKDQKVPQLDKDQRTELINLYNAIKGKTLILSDADRKKLLAGDASPTTFFETLKAVVGIYADGDLLIKNALDKESFKKFDIKEETINGINYKILTDKTDGSIIYVIPEGAQVKDLTRYQLPTGKIDGKLDVVSLEDFKRLIAEGFVKPLGAKESYTLNYMFAVDSKGTIVTKGADGKLLPQGWKLRTGSGANDFSLVSNKNTIAKPTDNSLDSYGDLYFDSQGNVFQEESSGLFRSSKKVTRIVGLLSVPSTDGSSTEVAQEVFGLGYGFNVYKRNDGTLYRVVAGKRVEFNLDADPDALTQGVGFTFEQFVLGNKVEREKDLEKLVKTRRIFQNFLGTLINGPTGYYKSAQDKINAELGWTETADKYLQNTFFKPNEWEEFICTNLQDKGYPQDIVMEADKNGNKLLAIAIQGRKDKMPDNSTFYEFSWLVRPQTEDYLFSICAGKCDSSCKLLKTADDTVYQDIAVPAGQISSGSWAGYSNKTVSTVSICYVKGGRRNLHSFLQPIAHKTYNPDEDVNRYGGQDPDEESSNDPESETPVSSVPQGAEFL